MNNNEKQLISIVVPMYNEQDNAIEMVREITEVCSQNELNYELIIINDGSQDDTSIRLQEAQSKYDPEGRNIKVIEFRRNFAKTAAIAPALTILKGW